MSVSGRRICRFAEEAAEAPDPEIALRSLTQLRGELQEFERQQVARALTAGRSFGDVGRAMGISRQAAHRRFKDLSGMRRADPERLPPTPEVRLVFHYARAEAEKLGAASLAPYHVVLGVLRNGDRLAARALTEAGVTLEDARREVRALEGGPAATNGHGDLDVRGVLAGSVLCAKRRGAEQVEVEHLLRSALADDDGVACRVLRRLGASPAGVLAALDAPPANREDSLEVEMTDSATPRNR
jgi:hypothetical protein